MSSSSSLRRERLASLELPGRIWFGSKPVEPVRRLGTGIASLDALLDGGLPRGHLSEMSGAPSSGRTSMAHALLAAATRAGEGVAVVDTPDALDPRSLRAGGADLSRVLWVRPPGIRAALECAESILSAGGLHVLLLDLDVPEAGRLPPGVWARLGRGARRSGTVLAVLCRWHAAGSFASVSLTCTLRRTLWTPPPGRLLDGVTVRIAVTRNRFGEEGRTIEVRVAELPYSH